MSLARPPSTSSTPPSVPPKRGPIQGILGVSDEPLVSSDFQGDSRSSIIDSSMTMVIGGTLIKVLVWYDNEWGFSCRVADLFGLVAAKLLIAAGARRT